MDHKKLSTSALVAAFLLSACGGGGDESGSGNSGSGKEVSFDMNIDKEMEAPALFKEYQKAKKKAKESDKGDFMAPLKKYKGKTMAVTGVIKGKGTYTDPKTDESGPTISLKVGTDERMDDVTVNLKSKERQSELEEGMKVKAAGTYVTNYMGPTIHDSKVKVLEK